MREPAEHSGNGDVSLEMIESRSPHSRGNQLGRALWAVACAILFRPSPRPLHRWRNWLLRRFGANLHPSARVYPRCRVWAPWRLTMAEGACLADDVDCYNVAMITLGRYATVSQYSYLCAATHDYEDERHPLVPRPITIGERAWVAADVFIGPGVTIGEGAVVGARSAVFRDLPPWVVAVGTPAKAVGERRLRAAPGERDAAGARSPAGSKHAPGAGEMPGAEDTPGAGAGAPMDGVTP